MDKIVFGRKVREKRREEEASGACLSNTKRIDDIFRKAS
jgi:hypothetical protein